ncbi:MAG TPA: hypothetical protein VN851_18790 [Thermoanaerobaculia bacterium]|nr:hypothetical protein [Thermoanaerobaculia bacterium]
MPEPGILHLLRHGGEPLLDDILAGRGLRKIALRLALAMTLGAALYGAVFGSWHGPRLALYVAVKFPLVMFATTALTLLFSWIAARFLGLPLRLAQAAVLTLLALTVASLVLAALAPVAGLFVFCSPRPTPEARTAHNVLYLMHTFLVGTAGFAGTRALRRALGRLAVPKATVRAAYAIWVFAFAFVGGEIAWALRPFVGSVYAPVAFLREKPLDGNVYEFIFTDVLPQIGRSLDQSFD